jgi:hypothetical protein
MEQDPLLRGGKTKIELHESGGEVVYESRSKTILHATMLGIAPWLLFVGVIAIMFQFFHYYTYLTMTVLAVILVINIGFVVFETAHGKAWLWWLGMLSTAAVIVGVATGTYNYYVYLLYFYSYADMRKYTNVAGSQLAGGFADAGMMLFTKGTSVDTTSAVGFQDPDEAGTVFCVAPILDGSMTKNDMISFWAVGQNCCEERANFECDGAGDASAKSGLVVLEIEKLVSDSVLYFINDTAREQYTRAIKLQNAVFGTSTAKENVYVRWTKDPVAMQETFWNKAFSICVTESVVYFILSLFMGISAALQARPRPKTLY